MPRYESTQAIIGYVRRLPAQFSGFNAQSVQMPDGPTQMSLGHILYRDQKISIAIFTRASDKQDCIVLSRPLFYIPETGIAELFEQLLLWNNGATESVHFAVDEPMNTINLICLRPITGLHFQEFQHFLDNLVIASIASINKLLPEYGLMRLQ